ncbi:RNA polymerase sigma factor [Stieleria sp.]|uniref:RNA polymerase sigma factor n=1 Tax=Stieleria sp. TaxID=2795976 RepID=UPI00356B5A64
MTKSDNEFPDTRASLLVQVQAGDDPKAWDEFVAVYRPILYRLARRRGLQDADAEDLAQQVLVSIARSIEGWQKRDDSTRFRHWLRRVAKNAILNMLTRGPKERAAGSTSVQEFLNQQGNDDSGPARELELEYRREIFFRAAALVKSEIATDSWKVFELAVIEDIPIEQVAATLGKSVGAVYAARSRVMKRLRRYVEDMENHES